MADHPLRPATDRRLGGPLPRQQANPASAHPIARGPEGSPAFTRRSYAVLVRVSPGYPPRLGRFRCIPHPSATRHQESKLSHAAVRLACVRHAASVQSEPGSNSSLKFSTTPPLRASSSVLSKRMSQPKTHCCVSIGWTLALLGIDRSRSNARRPHNSPAHTVKDLLPATVSTVATWSISPPVSRLFYIEKPPRQHPVKYILVFSAPLSTVHVWT